ncbi:unnamed protein product [Vitrella brassicaformis CCMP3155]|uniref:AMP-dependent synthetase/ligase domain-containing protein n=1 Tax=Vitrella brassicaformis (strain CCMP3155) TaxID=1169540 RepID=A0A0G4GM80_VITBC|nr:unnamed protein product [Vitrella brassicaformis CCMP3155]|eukprot:CEM31302.1 unnamed protein product [Vitrella brassicaformis CCMP3155]
MAAEYLEAFSEAHHDTPFLSYWRIQEDKSLLCTSYTRGAIWRLAQQAAHTLRSYGIAHGDRVTHFMTANRMEDVVFRVAAVLTGMVPVTVNWQADSLDRVKYKISSTGSKVVLVDEGVAEADVAALQQMDGVKVHRLSGLNGLEKDQNGDVTNGVNGPTVTGADDRMIIFTSGTTGNPKGARLTYHNYEVNRKTFESFLEVSPSTLLTVVLVNPFHHTNSTAVGDWAIRRPNTLLHVVERYTTPYWKVLSDAAESARLKETGNDWKVVAPMVSRHIDFLDGMFEGDAQALPVSQEKLRETLSHRQVIFLLGSAPVGPTTVGRLQRHLQGKLPTVRFGSTETCLQVMGTPLSLTPEGLVAAFRRGWEHTTPSGEPHKGYYIGRPHHPFTEVMVVKSLKDDPLVESAEGETGWLVCRGGNIMTGYANSPTHPFTADNWYTNLGDVGFWLMSADGGAKDIYWQSRDAALVIKGGANYACEQINEEIKAFVVKEYGLPEKAVAVASIGMKVQSEHEDDCCVCLELTTDEAKARQQDIQATFIQRAKACKMISKGSKPDRLLIDHIPRNFKGAISLPDLQDKFKAALGS